MEDKVAEPKIARHWHSLYIEMQADPYDRRTDKQFCEELQLPYDTFMNWKRKYRPFIFREVEAIRKTYRNEVRALAHKALTKKVEEKDTNALKLLFQLLGDLVEKSEVKTEILNDADKIRRLESLRETNQKKQRQWEQAESNSSSDSQSGLGTPELGGPEQTGTSERASE